MPRKLLTVLLTLTFVLCLSGCDYEVESYENETLMGSQASQDK